MVKDIEEQEKEGGYELLSVEKDSNLECSICLNLLRDAMGTPCSHLFCRSCIQRLADQQKAKFTTFDCPECRKPIEKEKIYPSAFADRLVKGSNVYCSQKTEGCEWTGSLTSFLEQHEDACPFQVIECHHLGCKHSSMKRKMDEHVSECKYQMIECEYCEDPIRMNQVHEHSLFCEKMPTACPQNECNISAPRIEIQEHLDQDCQFVVVNCSYAQLGCSVKVLRKDLEEHYEKSMKKHMAFLCDQVKQSQSKVQELETSNKEMRNRIKQLENEKDLTDPNDQKEGKLKTSRGSGTNTVAARRSICQPPLSNDLHLKPIFLKGIDKWIRKKTNIEMEKNYMDWYDDIFNNMQTHRLYCYDNAMLMKGRISNKREVTWFSNGKERQDKISNKDDVLHKDLLNRYVVREVSGSLIIDTETFGIYRRTNSRMFLLHRFDENKIFCNHSGISNRKSCFWEVCLDIPEEFDYDNYVIVCMVKDI